MNMVMNVLFVVPMVMLEVPGAHAGLALATALSAWLNAALLFTALRRAETIRPQPGWPRLLGQILIGVVVMGVVVGTGMPDKAQWSGLDTAARVMQLGIWVAAGVASYLLTLRLAGVKLSLFRAPVDKAAGNP